MRMLTLRKSVGLHHIQKSVQHVEQNPDRPRFIMGQRLVNSRRHITEIQLSRGRESPRLRLLLEFSGRCQHPQQQQQHYPGLRHRVQFVVKLELNKDECKLKGDCLDSYLPLFKGEGIKRGRGESECRKCPDGWTAAFFKSCRPRRDSLRASLPAVWGCLADANGAISSLVSGPRCLQSHRDERACRLCSSICALGEELRHGNGRGCAPPSHL